MIWPIVSFPFIENGASQFESCQYSSFNILHPSSSPSAGGKGALGYWRIEVKPHLGLDSRQSSSRMQMLLCLGEKPGIAM